MPVTSSTMDISIHSVTFDTVRILRRAGTGVDIVSGSDGTAVFDFMYAQQSGAP